ncbi:MAG: porin [Burkholderiales bacterium]|nr:porin [Burkholderiales bacterium]
MKKSILSAAVLALACGGAMAQSSVTAFGIIDLAARSMKGADSVKYLSNEGRSTSRLGFRGVEDMGGGLKAGFHIESQVNPDDGTANSPNFWQRRATVSLMGGFGEIRLGRDKSQTRTLQDQFDPFGTSGMPGLNRLMALDRNRLDNTIIYFLPSMGGVYGSVAVSAGENNNTSNTQRSTAGRLGYKIKAMDVSAAYGQFGNSNKLKITALGGNYAFGDFTLMGQYSQYKQGATSLKVSNLGAFLKMGSGRLIASFGNASGAANRDASLMAFGYDHSLSKRTMVYGTYARISNDGTSTFSLNGANGRALPVAGGNSTGYEVGVRHTF